MVTLTRTTVLLAIVAFAAWLGHQGSAKGARPKSPPSMASATAHFPEHLCESTLAISNRCYQCPKRCYQCPTVTAIAS